MINKLLAGLFAISLAGAALAEPVPFSEIDVNGDGVLSVEEAEVVDGLVFSVADTDENGELSEQEYYEAIAKGVQS